MVKEEIFDAWPIRGWTTTQSVSRYMFIGNNEIDETTETTARSLFPEGFTD
jgi:hypothetical protein